jgi:uncharacterized protein YciI
VELDRRVSAGDGSLAIADSAGTAAAQYVLLYASAGDVVTRAPNRFPAHRMRLVDFHARGTLLMVSNAQEEGSMAISTCREAAQEFAEEDPFVLNGVVRRWQIRQWNEIVGWRA